MQWTWRAGSPQVPGMIALFCSMCSLCGAHAQLCTRGAHAQLCVVHNLAAHAQLCHCGVHAQAWWHSATRCCRKLASLTLWWMDSSGRHIYVIYI